MAYVITQSCCSDGLCYQVCPANAIHPSPDSLDYNNSEMLYIDPNVCTSCGACEEVCPANAIYAEENLPDKYQEYKRINEQHFSKDSASHHSISEGNRLNHAPKIESVSELTVAIVGSGPAGFYAAQELLEDKSLSVKIDMYEKLPTPWGLIRYGVAPDHWGTKEVAEGFRWIAKDERFRLFLNVEVGIHISDDELSDHYDAVIYTIGASKQKKLGLKGEDIAGCHSAVEFTRWYNGYPGYDNNSFDLSHRKAVIIGNGNVALDIARLLLMPEAELKKTDMADYAIQALAESNVEEVIIVGRRSPIFASFTYPELAALVKETGLNVQCEPSSLQFDDVLTNYLNAQANRQLIDSKLDLLSQASSNFNGNTKKQITFRFLMSPQEIIAESGKVKAISLLENCHELNALGDLVLKTTGAVENIEAGLVIMANGFTGEKHGVLPFDNGKISNIKGRVIDFETDTFLIGAYTAGWVKRGPSGFIGSNKKCAKETVMCLKEDLLAGKLIQAENSNDDILNLIKSRQPNFLTNEAWERLNQYEILKGKAQGRPRVKETDVGEWWK